MKKSPPSPPKDLSPDACAIWARLHGEYDIVDAGGIEVLTAGLRAFDVGAMAEAQLRLEGLTLVDRYGGVKAHPAVDIAKGARSQWLQSLRMLKLLEEENYGTA